MSEAGQKIIEGLHDALEGKFTRVEQGNVAFIRFKRSFRHAGNWQAYAVGKLNKRGQLHVRRIIWGRLMAREEKREGEVIRRAHIMIDMTPTY